MEIFAIGCCARALIPSEAAADSDATASIPIVFIDFLTRGTPVPVQGCPPRLARDPFSRT
jgi:hypothetical protein